MQPGLNFESDNYSAGPGIASPTKVFGAADAAVLTNQRLDKFIATQEQEKQQDRARLQKMMQGLDVKPTGMYSKDLPGFVKAKAMLEQFAAESAQKGVDINNPRYISEYQKAKNYADQLTAMVQASNNTNKALIEYNKQADAATRSPNSKADIPASNAYAEKWANAPLEERMNMKVPTLIQKQFDEVAFIDKEIKPLAKIQPDVTTIGAEKVPVNFKRLDELTEQKENEGLDKDEKAELNELKQKAQYNKDVVPGYTSEKTVNTYGPRVEFDIPNSKGGQTEFASLPGQMIGLGRTALGNTDWSDKINQELTNYRLGKDAFGNIPMKIVDGKPVQDDAAMDLNREQYRNMLLAAESYSKDGTRIDAVELASALRINESFKIDESIEAAAAKRTALRPTEYTKEYARWINSKAGHEATAQEGATDYLAKRMQALFTGSDTEYKEVNGKRVPIQLIFDRRGLGNEVNDGVNKKSPNSMIDGYFEDGSLYIKTTTSAKNVNPEVQAQVDKIQLEINKIKDDPSKRTGKGRWIDAQAELDYNTKKRELDKLIDGGGYSYVRYGAKDGIKFMMDYIKANYPPNQVAAMQNQFLKSAEKMGLYDAKTGNSVIGKTEEAAKEPSTKAPATKKIGNVTYELKSVKKESLPIVKKKSDYDNLPKGTKYVDKNGTTGVK